MAKVLLDTSIVIDFLRRKDKEKSQLFFLSRGNNKLFVSIITHTELYSGKSAWENKKAHQELETLFSGIKILPLDEEISQKAGKIRAEHNTNLLDAIIAATAIEHSLLLSTLNLKDFEKIKDLKILRKRDLIL